MSGRSPVGGDVGVRSEPLLQTLEGHDLEVARGHSGCQDVLQQARVEDVGLDGSSAAGEKLVQRLRVRDGERAAGPIESDEALENPFHWLVGDLGAHAVGEGHQRLPAVGQEGEAEGVRAEEREGSARFQAHGLVGRRRARLFDLGRERVELELGEESLQLGRIRRLELQELRLERNGQIRRNGGQAFREERRLAVLSQAFAGFALDLAGLRQEIVEVSVLGDPLSRRDLAHARHAGDVVGGVAHQRQNIHHLRWGDAEEFLDAGFVQEPLSARVVDAHAGAHQLQHVLVGRHDDGVVAPAGRLGGERSDHVVRLVARHFEDRNPVRLADLPHERDLGGQIDLHLFAVGLVGLVGLVAQRLLGTIESNGERVGLVLAEHLLEHHHEAVDGVGWLSGGRGKTRNRVIRAVNVRHCVDQVERGTGFRHGNRDSK